MGAVPAKISDARPSLVTCDFNDGCPVQKLELNLWRVDMIEAERPCLEIAQQLQAVESAIAKAKQTHIHDHLDHCLESAVGSVSRPQRAVVDEFKRITKYL